MMFFKSNKKGQFQSVLTAVLVLFIFITALVYLNNEFENFPALNEMPAQLNQLDTRIMQFENAQQSNLEALFARSSFAFLNDTTRQTIILNPTSNGILKATYEQFLVEYVYKDSTDNTYDITLIRRDTLSEDLYRAFVVRYSPSHVVRLKSKVYDSRLVPIIWKDLTTNSQEAPYEYKYDSQKDVIFYNLPVDDTALAYRYEEEFITTVNLEPKILALLTFEDDFDTVRKDVTDTLQPLKNQFDTTQKWREYLLSSVEEDGITQLERLREVLVADFERKYWYLEAFSYEVILTDEVVYVNFDQENIQVVLRY